MKKKKENTIPIYTIDDLYKTFYCLKDGNPFSLEGNFKCPVCKTQYFIKLKK